MSNVFSGDKEFLTAMVAATLQDLRPPVGLSQDPMPGKDADPELHQAWLARHTAPQKRDGYSGSSSFFLGDVIYDHYTARAVLGGMSFDARGKPFTLQEALLNLGVNEPDMLIDAWKKDFTLAADAGDKIMKMLNCQVVSGSLKSDVRSGIDVEDPDSEDMEELGLPYGLDQREQSLVSPISDCLIGADFNG